MTVTRFKTSTGRDAPPQEPHDSPPLVLASRSPRRRELLAAIGARFEIHGIEIDETPHPNERADVYCRRVASEKAAAVRAQRKDRWILAADTVVVIDDVILGKPIDDEDARRTLQRLSGRRHRVLTAVTLLAPDGSPRLETLVESRVEFRRLSANEIDEYVATGEPRDKAGAYAVQGVARRFVKSVEGSLSSVIGLPVESLEDTLRRCGLLGETPPDGHPCT